MNQSNDPLHGITLKAMLNHLVERYGWQQMGYEVRISCFNNNPTINSSLKFLRRTPWARKKVEQLYLRSLREKQEFVITRKPRHDEGENQDG